MRVIVPRSYTPQHCTRDKFALRQRYIFTILYLIDKKKSAKFWSLAQIGRFLSAKFFKSKSLFTDLIWDFVIRTQFSEIKKKKTPKVSKKC